MTHLLVYSLFVTNKHERLPELIAAAVRVFTQQGYRAARMREVREFIAEVVPFGTLAAALSGTGPGADGAAAELEKILRELYELESRTREAANMLERSARELPELADLLNTGFYQPVLTALTSYLSVRASAGLLRRTPAPAATARLVLETLTWFARHRFSDPYGAVISDQLAEETAVDALVHALVIAS